MSEIEIKDVMYKVSKRNMRSCHPGSVPRKVRYFSCPKYTSVESLKKTIRKYFGKESSQTVYVFWKDSNGTKIPINYDKGSVDLLSHFTKVKYDSWT